MADRIKGQDTELIITIDNVQQDSLRAVADLSIEWQLEIMSTGFLGETSDRKDEVFKGVKGTVTLQLDQKGVFAFVNKVVARARSKTPGVKVNCKTSLRFPNGDRPRIMLPDMRFGAMPLSFAGRAEFGTLKLDFETSSYKVLGL